MVTPLITQQIEDFSVAANSNDSTFELFTTFDDPQLQVKLSDLNLPII